MHSSLLEQNLVVSPTWCSAARHKMRALLDDHRWMNRQKFAEAGWVRDILQIARHDLCWSRRPVTQSAL